MEVSSNRGLSNSRQWSTHTDPGHWCGQNGLPVTEGTISPAVPYPAFEDSFPIPTGSATGRRAWMEVSSDRSQWSTHTDPGHCCGQNGLPVTEGRISPVVCARWSRLPVRTKNYNLKIDKTLLFSTQGCPELQGKLFVCLSW